MARQTDEERKKSLKIKQQKRKGKQAYTPLTEKQKEAAMKQLIKYHPDYQMKDAQFCAAIHDYLPTVKEWTEWFEKEFIDITEERCQREIVRWYNKQSLQTKEFQELASNCSSIAELAEKIFGNHTEDVVS